MSRFKSILFQKVLKDGRPTSQEDNNNQKNLCDDLEENVGVLAAYGNVVKSVLKRIPSIEDLPEQSENKEEEEFIEIHN